MVIFCRLFCSGGFFCHKKMYSGKVPNKRTEFGKKNVIPARLCLWVVVQCAVEKKRRDDFICVVLSKKIHRIRL